MEKMNHVEMKATGSADGRTNEIMVYSAILCVGEHFVIRGELNQKAPPAYHRLKMGCLSSRDLINEVREGGANHTAEMLISEEEIVCQEFPELLPPLMLRIVIGGLQAADATVTVK